MPCSILLRTQQATASQHSNRPGMPVALKCHASAPKRRATITCSASSLLSRPPPPRSTAAPHATVRLRHSPRSSSITSGAAMELFPDGAHVRLRSGVHGTYLHADADGEGISTSSQPASLNTAWAVHRLARGVGGGHYVLLRSAAYGRYLALWAQPAAPPLGVVHRPVLRAYDAPQQDDVLWVVARVGDEGDSVLLHHARHDSSFLGVTADNHDIRRAHWVVEAIAPRQRPPILPAPVPLSRPMVLWRTIAYVRADDEGNFDPHPLARRRFIFYGRSVFQLTGVLSILLRESFFSIRLCVRAGSQGRLTPLVIDLPANEQPMDIVVLTAESPAAQGQGLVVYPDVDA